jgi:hypothetical protein
VPLQIVLPAEEEIETEGTSVGFAELTVMLFVTVQGTPSFTSTR